MKTVIVLTTFNRPQTLAKCLNSLKKSYLKDQFELLVVRQVGNKKTEQIIKKIKWIRCSEMTVIKPLEWSVKRAINHNIRSGISYAFDKKNADAVIVLEDDILVGHDFLYFCKEILKKYENDFNFRAVNGFSNEKFDSSKMSLYGKYIYGVGKGWGINRKIWQQYLKNSWTGMEEEHFDYLIEPIIKKGFVVMPYNSRTCDVGWENSSHTSSDQNDPYYQKLFNSWVKDRPFKIKSYQYQNKYKYRWRTDCLKYNWFNRRVMSPFYLIMGRLFYRSKLKLKSKLFSSKAWPLRNIFEIFGVQYFSKPFPGHHELLKQIKNNNGFFVEVGAFDGYFMDPTYYLEKFKNWSGLLVEPIRKRNFLLKAIRSKSKVVNYACVSNTFKDDFIEMQSIGPMSIVKPQSSEHWTKTAEKVTRLKKQNERVPAVTLTKLLDQYLNEKQKKKIDLLCIDVENFEIDVLNGLDLSKYKPQFILVECLNNQNLIQIKKKLKGYQLISFIPHSDYLFKIKK